MDEEPNLHWTLPLHSRTWRGGAIWLSADDVEFCWIQLPQDLVFHQLYFPIYIKTNTVGGELSLVTSKEAYRNLSCRRRRQSSDSGQLDTVFCYFLDFRTVDVCNVVQIQIIRTIYFVQELRLGGVNSDSTIRAS